VLRERMAMDIINRKVHYVYNCHKSPEGAFASLNERLQSLSDEDPIVEIKAEGADEREKEREKDRVKRERERERVRERYREREREREIERERERERERKRETERDRERQRETDILV
jgi:hypothetical protein